MNFQQVVHSAQAEDAEVARQATVHALVDHVLIMSGDRAAAVAPIAQALGAAHSA